MNKTKFLEIMQKRTTHYIVLSAILVGVMLLFLTPNLVIEAQARFDANAVSSAGPFSNVEGKMEPDSGHFVTKPYLYNYGYSINWVTTGGGIATGDEKGTVEANVGNYGKVTFSFNNPISGRNTCDATAVSPSLNAFCMVGQGNVASILFTVLPKSQTNTNSYCDILAKSGNLEQTKVIREKLRC